MDYSGNIASADAIKIVLESNRRMIDRVTETMRIAIAHTNSQSSVLIKTVSRELITKNLQPLLSQQSTMQAIVKIQSEQIAKISKSLPNISNLYLAGVYSSDAKTKLIHEQPNISYSVESNSQNLNSQQTRTDSQPIWVWLLSVIFVHYISDPTWNYVDMHYTFPTVLRLLQWFVQLISVP